MPAAAVNGIELSYEVTGEGPPVLLICGTGQAAAMWPMTGVFDALAGHTVIAFDNRGIAPSSVPSGPYTVEQLADDAIGLLEHLDVGPVAVLGASLGGTIAQRVALQRPDLVRAAIFVVGVNRISSLGRATLRGLIDLQVRAAVDRMPDGRYVEIPDSPHMPMTPDAQAVISDHVTRFLVEL